MDLIRLSSAKMSRNDKVSVELTKNKKFHVTFYENILLNMVTGELADNLTLQNLPFTWQIIYDDFLKRVCFAIV